MKTRPVAESFQSRQKLPLPSFAAVIIKAEAHTHTPIKWQHYTIPCEVNVTVFTQVGQTSDAQYRHSLSETNSLF